MGTNKQRHPRRNHGAACIICRAQFMDWYNEERLHSSLEDPTPDAVYWHDTQLRKGRLK